jgi:hypothetical protein
MKLKRHIAPLGLAFALLGACGSKEKEQDAVATTEEQADAESDDASEDASEGAAAESAAVKDGEPGGKRERGDKGGDAANIRERRAERLVRRAGDQAAPGGDAAAGGPTLRNPAAEGLGLGGPKLVKPQKPGVEGREGPVEANASGPAVAVDPSAAAAPSVAEAKTEPPQPTLVKPAGEPGDAKSGAAPTLTETPQPVRTVQPAGNLPTPDVKRFLPLVTAAEIVGQKSLKEFGPLAGIATVSGYNSLHYATSADRFGVAVQVWNDGTLRETEDRFRRMRLQHPNAEDVEAMKPVKGFYSGYMAIQSLTFIRPDKQLVYTVSCDEGLCDHAKLLRLARAVDGRL